MVCQVSLLFVSFLLFFAISPVDSTVKCYKGFSGDGRPFKQRLCQTEYCIKTTEPTGGATYGCDDFTPFCKADECVVTSKQSEVCCCNTDLCNSSSMPFAVFLTTVSLLLVMSSVFS